MKKNKNLSTPAGGSRHPQASGWLVSLGLLAIMASMPLIMHNSRLYGCIYAAGCVMLFVGRLLGGHPSKVASLRLRRLCRMELWTALIFAVGAVFIFLPQGRGNDWIAFTMAGAVLTLFTSIMIPRQKAKDAREEKNK